MRVAVARLYTFLFGLAYLVIAFLEVLLGELKIGKTVLLDMRGLQNFVHWSVGILVFTAYLAGDLASKALARVIGLVFAGITVWGYVAPDSLGNLLGYEGKIPPAYNVIHLVTAALGLFAGFAATRVYGADGEKAAA